MPRTVDEPRIFAAALKLLIAHGFEGATTQKIARAAGVNEVTLFRRYGSKARLFDRVIQHELADTPLTSLAFSGDLEADLLAIVKAYVATNAKHGDIIPILLVEMPRYRELRRALRTPWANLQGIIGILQRYQRQGLLRNELPLGALSALIGPILIAQMLHHAEPQIPVPPLDLRAHVSSFLDGRRGVR
jgi:AcrR family transcriptional regulator